VEKGGIVEVRICTDVAWAREMLVPEAVSLELGLWT